MLFLGRFRIRSFIYKLCVILVMLLLWHQGILMQRRVQTVSEQRSYNLSYNCHRYRGQLDQMYQRRFGSVKAQDIYQEADILIDKSRHFFFCKVPKAASTSWVDSLLNLYDMKPETIPIGSRHIVLRRQMAKPMTEKVFDMIMNRIGTKEYWSFMTIRHPFERLVSAYRDKFFVHSDDSTERFKANKFRKLYSIKIIEQFRTSQYLNFDEKYKETPTFNEFIQYLLHIDISQFNEHWVPLYLYCLPCLYNFTYIVDTETLTSDSKIIMNRLNSNEESLPINHITGNSRNPYYVTSQYMNQISVEDKEKLYQIYELDFKLFNFDDQLYK